MAKYKLKDGVKCTPFGPGTKEVVNKLSKSEEEAALQMPLTDELAAFLIESGRLTMDDFELIEEKPKK